MISQRLLFKLQEGKKYLFTDGIKYYIFIKKEDRIWVEEYGCPSEGRITLHMKEWEDILLLELKIHGDDYWYVKNYYNLDNPTYRYDAFISRHFACGSVDFNTYNLFFLGEFTQETNIGDLKRYCNLFGISYKWENKKERRKSIYKNK